MLKHQGNMKWYSIYNDDPVQQHVLMNTPRGYECVRVRMISTWFILINLVCLCLPEVLLSARASPSPNKVQGCNDCMLSCKHLFMERVCAVCDHVTDKISTLTPADRLCKKGRTLGEEAFVLFYLFFSFIFVLHFFFLQTAQSRWMRYIATQLQGVATLYEAQIKHLRRNKSETLAMGILEAWLD